MKAKQELLELTKEAPEMVNQIFAFWMTKTALETTHQGGKALPPLYREGLFQIQEYIEKEKELSRSFVEDLLEWDRLYMPSLSRIVTAPLASCYRFILGGCHDDLWDTVESSVKLLVQYGAEIETNNSFYFASSEERAYDVFLSSFRIIGKRYSSRLILSFLTEMFSFFSLLLVVCNEEKRNKQKEQEQ